MAWRKFPQPLGVVLAIVCGLAGAAPASAQVLFQQFYYPIDKPPVGTTWWQQATGELEELARIGVYAIWHPVPVKGGSGAVSMGYDPYDLYDLGSKNQKGTVPTNFGTKDEYLNYIAVAHSHGLRVYADVVLNHTGGADKVEPNPLMERLGFDDVPDDSKIPPVFRPDTVPPGANLRSWSRFTPKGADGQPGTGRFPRDLRHFHPSTTHPDRKGPYHNPEFGSDYCHEAENRYVWNEMIRWANWFRAQTGVDGFRLDAVKLVDPPFLADFATQMNQIKTANSEPFYQVGEFWDTNPGILADFMRETRHQMRIFDFGLFYALWDMTEKPGEFDMRDLWIRRNADRERSVSFVSNHDVDRFQPIKRDKRILPYAITMAMSGQPSLFYLDYFRPEDKNLPAAVASLIAVHNNYAKGREILRLADPDVLALEREGNLLALFNDGGKNNTPRTVTVKTTFGPNIALVPVGQWGGNPPLAPARTNPDGTLTATILPGNYLLLVPQKSIRAKRTEAGRSAMPTRQVWEFADDLDMGRLGTTPRSVSVTAKQGTPLTARVTESAGNVTLTVQDASGKWLQKVQGNELKWTVPASGTYQLVVTATQSAPNARLHVTYFGAKTTDR